MSVAMSSSPVEDERRGDNIKKARYSWYVTLESESPTPTDEDEESVYTVQGNETEFARDTSDTSTTHTWISSNESDASVNIEYELDSQPENENPFTAISSSSEPENNLAVEFITFCDSDGLADGSDDSTSSIDSEIKKVDFWTCVLCKNPNNNPMFRYCEKCYQLRKTNFMGNRPRRKRRAQKDQGKTLRTTVDAALAQELCDMDSGIASSQDLERAPSDFRGGKPTSFEPQSRDLTTMIFGANRRGIKTESTAPTLSAVVMAQPMDRDEVDSILPPKQYSIPGHHPYPSDSDVNGLNFTKDRAEDSEANMSVRIENSQSPLNILSKKLQLRKEEGADVVDSSEQQAQGLEGLCLICTVRPKNGAFVHGKITHICCCYPCAMKVWMTNGNRCPICNRKVTQLLKAFYA
ncbi:PREDICTED: E3 ubiquitin-protein ligase Mdm2-like isoform X2 [Ceratosolen solmsi marchali]|uniref:E3 ubiquitin-protein ligase Mdm2-like isoform X2 n=1 Tax=Ceratosolen solmsi marchali TaxID=326594 RepID=A0AAJ6YGC5_9HYME|nr:PREDICTED: E3 ubiquitin-protein ligase Mdm2-like isoform X2 [Ceratosolen solmsi marchali]